jgi:predicted permease
MPASTITPTLIAALRSVGNACTLCLAGIYLKKRGLLDPATKKGLALISQQLTIPALLFSKLLNCNQDWSEDPCPNLASTISSGWLIALWPFFVVGSGLLVGWLTTVFTRTPSKHKSAVMVSIAFGNSTGLPLTLLGVIHNSYSKSEELGAVDPTLYLSVYLLLYPVLQWGVGGWLLTPPATPDQHELASSLLMAPAPAEPPRGTVVETAKAMAPAPAEPPQATVVETAKAIFQKALQPPVIASLAGRLFAITPISSILVDNVDRDDDAPLEWFYDGIYTVGQAAIPINMIILGANLAPMLVLPSFLRGTTTETSKLVPPPTAADTFRWQDNVGIVVSKLIVLPCVGFSSALLLHPVLPMDTAVDASFFLVLVIVFCCPTANTMVVMTELSGVSREALSQSILIQYLASPILLTISITVAVSIVANY